MGNIDNEIEIRRALNKTCSDTFVVKMLAVAGDFYSKLFSIYGLNYTPEIIKQKRQFVAKATEYYIVKGLPKSYIQKEANKYMLTNLRFIPEIQKHIEAVTNLINTCCNPEILEEEYSKNFHVKRKSLAKDLAVNRDDKLCDFAKAVEKIYNYKEDK